MNKKISIKTRAIFVGSFILVAYSILVSLITESKIIVILADVISGIAVIGIAVLMFPLFKNLNKKVSYGYLILKYVEGIIMIVAGLLFLFTSLQYTREIIYNGVQLYAFIISAFVFYYLLYESKLVPRFISIWGALGIFALMVSTVLNLIDINYPIIDYLLVLVITNEVFLAIWLMAKGFNKSEINYQELQYRE